MKIETLLTSIGRSPEEHEGAVNPPVYHASTILFPTLADFEAAEKAGWPLVYGRSGTPTVRELEAALAELDGAECAIVTSSGLAAIVIALTATLSNGDHLLIPDSLYGSARKFCDQELTRYGIEVTYYDPLVGAGITSLMKPNTKVIYIESPGSLTFEVQDIPAIVKAAHAKNAIVIADNTWATPLYLRTVEMNVDICIHSCTKYIGGHSDLVMGLITHSKKFNPQLRRTYRNLGAAIGADEVYFASRGLRTLAVRLKQHQETAFILAKWLAARPEVVKVLHPGLPSCPGHDIWKRDFKGASGLFSILLKPYPHKALAAMLDGLEHFGMGFSWGGYESLIIPFTPERTATPSWTHDGLCIRIHAGLEHPDDLIADLKKGFERLNGAA